MATDPRSWTRIRSIFERALELGGDERARFLDESCRDDAASRAEVERLLAADSGPVGVVDRAIERMAALAQTSDPRSLVGSKVGGFTIEGVLASGGMGTVYLAAQDTPSRRVALKVLKHGLVTGSAVKRFQFEAECLAKLRHPGIAQVYEAGSFEPRDLPLAVRLPYFAMEYVENARTIIEHASRQKLDLAARLDLFARVCDAVHHGHQRGVIHRDLKPGNVLVDASGNPKIIDYGVARVIDSETRDTRHTSAGELVGTLQYMSPEQLAFDPAGLDSRTDIYALGLILYELLCGKLPYDVRGKSLPEVARTIAEATVALPSRIAPAVPVDASWIVLKALEKDRERRYASASEMASDVRRFLADEPVHAGPPSAVYRAKKFFRRYRTETAAVGVALALSIVVPSGAAVVLARTNAQLERANVEKGRLADTWRHRSSTQAAEQLWPARPERVPELERWLTAAQDLAATLPVHRDDLARIEAQLALPATGDRAALELQREVLLPLVAKLETFTSPDRHVGAIASVRARIEEARSLRARSLEAHASAWSECVATLADPARAPRYGGLSLAPQLGLVPLGLDRSSGLFEFVDVATGELPERDAAGELVLSPASGIVFVLVPGGSFRMGAELPGARGDANLDPHAAVDEGPTHTVGLDAYLLAKHELTQAQWKRMCGGEPSNSPANWLFEQGLARSIDEGWMHPVSNLSWDEAVEVLGRFGLVLPTEAQWEHAARAGSRAPWWWGDDPKGWVGRANLADRALAASKFDLMKKYAQDEFDDGFVLHAPVDALAPNPNGFHAILGNVLEWCRDAKSSYSRAPRAGDGERSDPEAPQRCVRGGSFYRTAVEARVGKRGYALATWRDTYLGLRPARVLER